MLQPAESVLQYGAILHSRRTWPTRTGREVDTSRPVQFEGWRTAPKVKAAFVFASIPALAQRESRKPENQAEQYKEDSRKKMDHPSRLHP